MERPAGVSSSSGKVTKDGDSTATQDDSQSAMQKEPEKDESGDEKSVTVEVDKGGEENEIETSTGSIGKLIGEFVGPNGKIIRMYDFIGLQSSSGKEEEYRKKDSVYYYCQTYQGPKISDETLIDLELRLRPPSNDKGSCSSTRDNVNQAPCPSPNKKRKVLGESSSSSLRFSPSPSHEEHVVMASPNLQETSMVIAPLVLNEVNMIVAPPVLEEVNQVLPDQDPWRVRKVLTRSDVDSSSRLLIGKDIVKEHILPHVLRKNAGFEEQQGTELAIWDVDTGTEYRLRFKKWLTTNSFIFNGGWKANFVKRRNLMENDEIGLRWDDENSRLEFTVIRRNHQE